MQEEVVIQENAELDMVVSKITEPNLREFADNFRAEMANTMALVETIARELFGSDESEDLTVGEVYAYLMSQYAQIDQEIEEGYARDIAKLRLRRAVSVISIVYGAAMPKELLVLDRNVYDTIQGMSIIERNQKQLEAVKEAADAVAEVVVTH